MYRLLNCVYDWLTSDRADRFVAGVLVVWLGIMSLMVGLTIIWAVIG